MTFRRAVAAALAGQLLVPSLASAHGIAGRSDLPIPPTLFAWAASIVLVVSFFALGRLWSRARLQHAAERVVWHVPRPLGPLCGAVGVALFALVVYAGFAGEQSEATANFAPVFVYVIFWVGVPLASALLGDWFRAFNPWRATARAAAALARRTGLPTPAPRPYPERLGRWPAVVGILGFAWLELVYVHNDAPSTLAVLALDYAAIQLVGMAVYGIDQWERRGDAFAVYFDLFARLSPLRWADGRLAVRPPLQGVTQLDSAPGTVALLCAMIGSTSFDGLARGPVWSSIAPHLERAFHGLGASAATELTATVGLLAMTLLVFALYRLGVAGIHKIGDRRPSRELSQRFVHSLVPIALAYVVAHYFSFLIYQGQSIAALASDPLGHGANIFGTAHWTIDYGLIAAAGVWYVQVAALLVGHVSGLVLAHDRALILYRRSYDATRSQYWMLGVMVGFTCLALWLLAAAS
jgi:hypothetical protein